MSLGQAAFRTHFPGLRHTVYLASCSLGARCDELDKAMARMLGAMSSASAWEAFEAEAERARRLLAALIGAGPDQIALMPNASVGAYQAASAMTWATRPRIVTCAGEFPSLAHVWLAQRSRGADVIFVADGRAEFAEADYLAALDERAGLVSVPVTTYDKSSRLPVSRIADAAHAIGAKVFVDAYQALGTEPVDVTVLGCDYLVGGTSKYLLGLPGAAFLYCRTPQGEDRLPELTGWFGRADPFAFDPHQLDFASTARRFETGTPAVPALYAANAGLSLIGQLDLGEVRRHVVDLRARAAARLTELGERVFGPADAAAGGAHLALADESPSRMASWLAGQGVVVSPRGCAVRLALHFYTQAADIDEACDRIQRYRSLR